MEIKERGNEPDSINIKCYSLSVIETKFTILKGIVTASTHSYGDGFSLVLKPLSKAIVRTFKHCTKEKDIFESFNEI